MFCFPNSITVPAIASQKMVRSLYLKVSPLVFALLLVYYRFSYQTPTDNHSMFCHYLLIVAIYLRRRTKNRQFDDVKKETQF